jgi:ABC-type transport system involved in multi-copper enzyme maturation permease subunit
LRFSQSWIVTLKDFETFKRKRNIIYSIFVVPLLVSIMLPAVVYYIEHKGNGPVSPAELVVLLPAFAFFYLILAGLIPTTIASYSIVGEKVEKSLEPLLATPTTDTEILFGKGVAAFVLPMVALLGGAALFMGLTDVASFDFLGYYYFPNWNAVIVFFLMVPLAVVMSVEWNVLVSARVSDVRIAQQIGSLLLLPYGGVYVAGELDLIPLGDTNALLMISGILAAIVLLLLFVVRATFRRDEILTKWK